MTKTNQLIFEKLATLVDSAAVIQSKSKKYIKSTDKEKIWLKSVKYLKNEDLFIDSKRFFALALLENEKYVLQIGFEPATQASEDLILQPNNGGVFATLVAELDLPLLDENNLGLQILNNIFLPSDDNEEKVGFDFSDIEKYFTKYFLYKIKSDSTLNSQDNDISLQKVALYLLGNLPGAVSLQVSPKTRSLLQDLARLDIDSMPFDRVFRAFIERRYENSFLDLYRCLEMLFSLKKVDELRTQLNLELKHFEISTKIEATLGWRPIEKNALIEIINNFSEEILSSLRACFKNDAEVGANIYSLRNDCVHLRPLRKQSNLTKQVDWTNLLESMVLAIHYAYHVNYRKMF